MTRLGWIVLLCISVCHASQGDNSPAYARCLANNQDKPFHPSLSLRLTRWSAHDDLAYHCQQELTELSLSSTNQEDYEIGGKLEGLEMLEMVQFHGKWPFKRFLGIQEPLSVLFSILNLVAHYKGFQSISRVRVKSVESNRLQKVYKLNGIIGMNTWIFSSLFHIRDTPWTEKGDYFSAGFGIGFGLWLVIYRITGLYRRGGESSKGNSLKLIAFTAFISHCWYLCIGRFDYSYNMTANLTVGLVQIILWTIWSIPQLFSTTTPSAQKSTTNITPALILPLLPLFLLLLSTGFEVLDFAPIPHNLRLLDAHALWHASTVGIVQLWYRFLKNDLERSDR